MRKSLITISLVLSGSLFGWYAHDLVSRLQNTLAENVAYEENKSPPKKTVHQAVTPISEVPSINFGQKLLSNPKLDKVIELFKLEMDVSEQAQLDLQLVQYAKTLLREPRKHKNVENQLLTLSNIDTVQTQVLPLLISYYKKLKRNEAAIEQLYKLRNLLSFDEDFQRINKQIKQLTTDQIKRLEHANQKEKLADFYERMIAIEPDNYSLQMKFASFEYENRHYENAIRLLSVLIYHPNLEAQALKLLQQTQYQLSRQESGDLPINVEGRDGQYIVTAVINDLEPVKLMLDTGASLTILSPTIINSLGIYDAQKSMRFSTANGEVNAPIVVIDKIDIQNYLVRDIEVGVLPSFPMGEVDGLLGMNFLSQFSFFIDQENRVLHLNHIDSE